MTPSLHFATSHLKGFSLKKNPLNSSNEGWFHKSYTSCRFFSNMLDDLLSALLVLHCSSVTEVHLYFKIPLSLFLIVPTAPINYWLVQNPRRNDLRKGMALHIIKLWSNKAVVPKFTLVTAPFFQGALSWQCHTARGQDGCHHCPKFLCEISWKPCKISRETHTLAQSWPGQDFGSWESQEEVTTGDIPWCPCEFTVVS